MYQNPLKKTIEYLKGAGPERAKTLQSEFRIFRYEDLIQHFPFRYVDKSKFYKISEISSTAAEIQLKGKIVSLEEINQGKVKRELTNDIVALSKLCKWFLHEFGLI